MEISVDNSKGSFIVKSGLAKMLKNGVIVDVTSVEQAILAESAGVVAVMVMEQSSNQRKGNETTRMCDINLLNAVKEAVSIPVMSKVRVGHFAEAQILDEVSLDYLDESDMLSVADTENHINKLNFKTPFVCGCMDLGEGMRRIVEGAAMLRTQQGGTLSGNVAETVRQVRVIQRDIKKLIATDHNELFEVAKAMGASYELVKFVAINGKLPVVLFAAGGIATPADVSMLMQLGVEGVFVGSDILQSPDPYKAVKAMVDAAKHYKNPAKMMQITSELPSGGGKAGVAPHNMFDSRSSSSSGVMFISDTYPGKTPYNTPVAPKTLTAATTTATATSTTVITTTGSVAHNVGAHNETERLIWQGVKTPTKGTSSTMSSASAIIANTAATTVDAAAAYDMTGGSDQDETGSNTGSVGSKSVVFSSFFKSNNSNNNINSSKMSQASAASTVGAGASQDSHASTGSRAETAINPTTTEKKTRGRPSKEALANKKRKENEEKETVRPLSEQNAAQSVTTPESVTNVTSNSVVAQSSSAAVDSAVGNIGGSEAVVVVSGWEMS